MASIKEKKSLKSEFAKWLIDNPKVNYYKNDFYKIIQELDKYNDFFSLIEAILLSKFKIT